MYQFGTKSTDRLMTCDPRIIAVLYTAIRNSPIDFAVTCGFRNEHDQNQRFRDGTSKLEWPYSKHNKIPSLAVDVEPWPIDYEDIERYHRLAGVLLTVASMLGVPLFWAGDSSDPWFKYDLAHYELREK